MIKLESFVPTIRLWKREYVCVCVYGWVFLVVLSTVKEKTGHFARVLPRGGLLCVMCNQ